MLNKIKKLMLVGALVTSFGATATPITYIGADDSVSSINDMVNANAAAANFFNVTGSLNVFDFESPIPSNLTITGGSTTTVSSCGINCGFNTTAGGSTWHEVYGGSVTFTFTNPVDAFGFYVNGLQTDLVPQQTIEYVDGSSMQQLINMPSAVDGGGAFLGFVDFGQLISSVTFNATNDVLGFDDLYFGRSATNPEDPTAVPAPATLFLFGTGLFSLGLMRRSRKLS